MATQIRPIPAMSIVADDQERNFLRSGGFMGDMIRSRDWSETLLGETASWPQSLRTALSVCLNSRIVSALYWGPQFLTLYNDAYAPALAERHPRMLGQPLREVWAEIWDILGPQLIAVVETGEGFSTERQRLVMKRNGREEETFWLYSFAPIRGEGGNVAGVFVNAIDLTAQVEAEKALLKSREELRKLNDSLAQQVADRTADRNEIWRVSQDMLLVLGTDGIIRAANEAWTRTLAYTQEDLVGSKFDSFVNPEDIGPSYAALAEASTKALPRFENRYRHKDGSWRTLSWTAAPSGNLVYCVARDVTDDKRREREFAAVEANLRQSQKMEAVGQLTGGLAHDFNNLIAGISGSLELMQIRMRQGRLTDIDRYMIAAQGAAKRAAALTHRLLAFSRRQTLDSKPTDVNRLVSGMQEMIQRTVGPGIPVEVVGVSGVWPALVDSSQLENALLNLCINARDAMPDGGKITIETANKWIDALAARQLEMPEGQYLSLYVTDTGTGMPQDVVARAFEPFFTTKPTGEGTGLGLSMIYGFAKQSGGQVRIYSEIDKGTAVCIYLPRYYGEIEPEVPHKEKNLPRSEQSETVLVVDDEPTVRMLLTDILEDLGYTAIEAADSAAGLEVLQSDVRIDMLVTDVGLPGGMNGRQMADAGRVTRPDLKVLFITGYAENAILRGGQLAPGMAVLTKPFPVETMATRIRTIIETKHK